MIKHYCDICGKEFPNIDAIVRLNKEIYLINNVFDRKNVRYEICDDCYKKIYDFVEGLRG